MRPRALAVDEVADIRKWYRPGLDGSDMKTIADHYGVSVYTVHNVIHRRGAYRDASDDEIMTQRGIAQSFDGSTAGWRAGTRISVTPFNLTYVDVLIEEGDVKVPSRARLTRTDARRLAIALLAMSEGLE